MGDPKKIRKLYRGPTHPWQKERLESEIRLLKEYGLKNKKELWKVDSLLKKYMRQAKRLIALGGEQAEKERLELLGKMRSLGLLESESGVADVLGVSLRNLLDRRLQTILHKKQLARSMRQARQFIVHEHVVVGNHKITVPSYLVTIEEEGSIAMVPGSALASPDHPERAVSEMKPGQAPAEASTEDTLAEKSSTKQSAKAQDETSTEKAKAHEERNEAKKFAQEKKPTENEDVANDNAESTEDAEEEKPATPEEKKE